jgi:hypothetical protein
MTGRELIKQLEACDLDKTVAVVISMISETETGFDIVLRAVNSIMENETVIALN